jgi:hypothetical protein
MATQETRAAPATGSPGGQLRPWVERIGHYDFVPAPVRTAAFNLGEVEQRFGHRYTRISRPHLCRPRCRAGIRTRC